MEAFNDPKSEFVGGELFILALNYDGVTLAFGGRTAVVEKNMTDQIDGEGR